MRASGDLDGGLDMIVRAKQTRVDDVEYVVAAVAESVYGEVSVAKKVAAAVGRIFPGTRVILRQDATYGSPEFFDPSGSQIPDSVTQQLKLIEPRDTSSWPEHTINV
jgi:hypothetical protein